MIVSEIDASWGSADEFINYFDNFASIEDYLRYVKKEVINSTTFLHLFMMSFLMKTFILKIWSLTLSLLEIDSSNLFHRALCQSL